MSSGLMSEMGRVFCELGGLNTPVRQGLTLVHFSAKPKPFLT